MASLLVVTRILPLVTSTTGADSPPDTPPVVPTPALRRRDAGIGRRLGGVDPIQLAVGARDDDLTADEHR